MQIPRLLTAIAAVAVTATLLSGCSTISEIAKGQTKIQACAAIDANLLSITAQMKSLAPDAQSDPAGTAKKLDSIASKFAKTASKVKNPTVKKATVKASDSLTTFSKDLDGIVANPANATGDALTKFQTDISTLQTNFTKIDTICKP